MVKVKYEDVLQKYFNELEYFDEMKKAREKGILLPLEVSLYKNLINELYRKIKNLIRGGALDSLLPIKLTDKPNILDITSADNDIEEIVFNEVFIFLKTMNKNHHEESIVDDDIFLEALFAIRDEGILSLTLDDLGLKKNWINEKIYICNI